MPTVSVVLPVYDPAEEDLARALASVLGQTMDDLEVVVVDDGSSRPADWVRDVDDRVVYVRPENRGVSVARHVAVGRARADLVGFIDQDDVWSPLKLARQLAAVREQPDAAFWCTWFTWVVDGSRVAGDEREVSYLGLLSDRMVCQSSALVRRADYVRVGGQNPLLAQTQDWDLFLRLLLDAGSPVVVEEPLVDVHLHSGNASRDYARGAQERRLVLEQHRLRGRARRDRDVELAVAAGLRRTREVYGAQAVDAARGTHAERRRAETMQHLRAAAAISPRVLARSLWSGSRRRLGGPR